ncbi:MAG: hypothetical protein AAGA85_03680 [Bacteroidota bacterium]
MTAQRLFCLILLSASSSIQSFSQDFAQFVGKSDRNFFDGVYVASDLELLQSQVDNEAITKASLTPQKIGLASMYIYERNYQRRKAHLTYIYSFEGQQNYFYHNIGAKALKGLQRAFDGSPYEILLPSDFLDADDKHDAFASAITNINGLDHPFLDQMKEWKLQPSGNEQPFLYTWIEEGTNGFVADEMAALAQSLGLDALLTVQFSTLYQTQTISYYSLDLILHGINPTAPEGEQGIVLAKYSLGSDFPYPFVNIRNGKTSQERFGAYDRLTERSTEYFLDYLQLQIAELF